MDAMITTAQGGRKGVAVMTKAASERIDHSKDKHAKKSTKRRNRLFSTKTGEMI